MGNTIFASPNYLRETYFNPILGNGKWDNDNNVNNLKSKYFADKAICDDLTHCKLDIDFQVNRIIKVFAITRSNVGEDGKVKLQGSNSPAWDNVTLSTSENAGETSVSLLASGQANVKEGDMFTIGGDDTVYQATINKGLGENLIHNSDLTHSDWVDSLGGAIHIKKTGFEAPDGSNDAVQFEWVAGGNGLARNLGISGVADGLNRTLKIWVQIIEIRRSSGTGVLAWDIGDGTITPTTTSDIPEDGKWHEVDITMVADGSFYYLDFSAAAGVTYYKVRLWQPNLVNGSTAKSYVYTDGTEAGGIRSVSIRRVTDDPGSSSGLAQSFSGGEVVTCRSGNFFNSNVYDSGFVDYIPMIYGFTDAWGSPKIWLGKETNEERSIAGLPNQFIHILPNEVEARYWRVIVDDTTNSDGYIEIEDMHLSPGLIAEEGGVAYGAILGATSNSSVEKSAGGVSDFNVEKASRFVDITLTGLTLNDAVINFLRMTRYNDVHKDFIIILDDEAGVKINEMSLCGYFEELVSTQFSAYDWHEMPMRIYEKLG